MCVKAINVSSKVKGYAININDVVLREEMSQRLSYLLRITDTVTLDVCQFIHEKGTILLENLRDYGVTQEMLDDLQRSIANFRESIPKPRIGIVICFGTTARHLSRFGVLRYWADKRLTPLYLLVFSHHG